MSAAEIVRNETPGEQDFIDQIRHQHQSRNAHVFVLHGNVEDNPSNSGMRYNLLQTLGAECDTNFLQYTNKTFQPAPNSVRKIMVAYYMHNGLQFLSRNSEDEFKKQFKHVALISGNVKAETATEIIDNPRPGLDYALRVMNIYFEGSKALRILNREKKEQGHQAEVIPELSVTLVFFDADALFGASGALGDKAYEDRVAVVTIRNWAREERLGNMNRIILVTKSLNQMHESLRGGDSQISGILVPRPNLKDRETWLKNYAAALDMRPLTLSPGKKVSKVMYEEGFDAHQFAVLSAGLNRIQMEKIIVASWTSDSVIGPDMVRSHKKRVLEGEFGGLLDFHEPQHGFSSIGGMNEIKRYFQDRVLDPLLGAVIVNPQTDRKRTKPDPGQCSMGVLIIGPPGTAKTYCAQALSYESKLPCLHVHLNSLFGGIVGETETKTERMIEAIEAAAPCIAIIDEIDSALGQGRVSSGDSNTAGRMFNRVMTWLSDSSRRGRIIAVGISNRPDLLDAALIRSGRFDAVLPALPPAPSDVEERASILEALVSKFKMRFDPSLAATLKDRELGLGKMLFDHRIWTGAEMEVLLAEAIFKARKAGHKMIQSEDWEKAFEYFGPSTRDVEAYIDLSLAYTTHLEYCPPSYQEKARKGKELIKEARRTLSDFDMDYERNAF